MQLLQSRTQLASYSSGGTSRAASVVLASLLTLLLSSVRTANGFNSKCLEGTSLVHMHGMPRREWGISIIFMHAYAHAIAIDSAVRWWCGNSYSKAYLLSNFWTCTLSFTFLRWHGRSREFAARPNLDKIAALFCYCLP